MPATTPPPLHDRASLCAAFRKDERPKYLFFWGHTPTHGREVGKECMSQWYAAPFVIDGQRFATAEHFMMWRKARLFGDDETAAAILVAASPGAAKALGRAVRGFDESAWVEARFGIVVDANRGKFGQHPALRAFLEKTGTRVLVEASPVDRIWGIGLEATDERAENPLRWQGENLLGFALMRVREELLAGSRALD